MRQEETPEPAGLPDGFHDHEIEIRAVQIWRLYSQSRIGLLGALLGAAALVPALWRHVSHDLLIIWFVCCALVHASRHLLIRAFHRRKPEGADTIPWGRRFAWGTFFGAILWGSAGVILFPENSHAHQFLLAVFVTGIACGATAVYWPLTETYLPVILIEMLPMAGRFVYEGDTSHLIIGAAIAMFCGVLVIMARHSQMLNTETIRVDLRNQALLNSLEDARSELQARVQTRTEELATANRNLRAENEERRQAETALKASEEKYRLLFETAQEGVFIAQDAMIRFVNPSTLRIIGVAREEALSKPFTEFIHPDDRALVLESHKRRLSGEEFAQAYAIRLLGGAGETKWVELNSTLTSWDDKPATLVSMVDITEKKAAEDLLRKSEARYRAVFNSAGAGIFLADAQGGLLDFNHAFTTMLDADPGELVGRAVNDLLYEDDQKRFEKGRGFLLQGALDASHTETRFVQRDGSVVWGDLFVTAITDPQGGCEAVICVVVDVTGLKRAQEALRKSEFRFRSIYDHAPIMMHSVDHQGVLRNVNDQWLRVMGYTRDEVVGAVLDAIVTPERGKGLDTAGASAGGTGAGEIRTHWVKKDGVHIEVVVDSVMMEDPSWGEVTLSVVRDVTQQMTLERQLRQSQKMEAVGALAGGIAHDFNNLLTVILGYSDLMIAEHVGGPEWGAELEVMRKAARGGADLVRRMLTLSRRAEIKPIPMNINEEILEVQKMLLRTIPRMIRMEMNLDEKVSVVKADPGQVQQMLMNLALNAKDAMPQGGVLTIETKNVMLTEEFCRMHPGASPGPYVTTSVTDTGHGMNEATAQRIFEPFFTTKPQGKGTGLGLAMVYGIVRQHGGFLTCRSHPGEGTCFDVYLPTSHSTRAVRETPTTAIEMGKGETVLVVDDEDSIHSLARRILEPAGYKVIIAGNGREALDVYERSQGLVDLVILDLGMPEMGGAECFRKLKERHPKVKVIISTGYAAEGVTESAIPMDAAGSIGKPYDADKMLREIRAVLDAPGQ